MLRPVSIRFFKFETLLTGTASVRLTEFHMNPRWYISCEGTSILFSMFGIKPRDFIVVIVYLRCSKRRETEFAIRMMSSNHADILRPFLRKKVSTHLKTFVKNLGLLVRPKGMQR